MMIKTLAALVFDSSRDPGDEATAAQRGRAAIVVDAKGLLGPAVGPTREPH